MSLERFITAQEADYATALAEIRAGQKRSHWIWYILPNLAGLGYSETARFYALRDADEARQYFADPILGPRLSETVGAIADTLHSGTTLLALFGHTDALKTVSCLTLFTAVIGNAATAQQPWQMEFVTAATGILAVAATQGYPRCGRTAELLGES